MKEKLFLSCMIICFSIIYATIASAGWTLSIHAIGHDLGGQFKSDVINRCGIKVCDNIGASDSAGIYMLYGNKII